MADCYSTGMIEKPFEPMPRGGHTIYMTGGELTIGNGNPVVEDAIIGKPERLSLPRIPLDIWFIGWSLLAVAAGWAAWKFGLIGLVMR